MEPAEGEFVWVRRQWNDWRIAKYDVDALEGVHWDTTSGGIQAPTPQPFLHGYVWCNGMVEGELAHSCGHGAGPHRIKVCVVKKDNHKNVIARLLALAGPKPVYIPDKRRKQMLAQLAVQAGPAHAPINQQALEDAYRAWRSGRRKKKSA